MTAVQLNRITHAIPWQAEVAKATSAARAAAPWAERVQRSTARSAGSASGRSSFHESAHSQLMGPMR